MLALFICFHIKNQYKKRVIYAKKNVEMFSKVFGKFKLINDKTYRFHFTNTLGTQAGKDVFKSIDDYWFSKKRLDELLNNEEIDNLVGFQTKVNPCDYLKHELCKQNYLVLEY